MHSSLQENYNLLILNFRHENSINFNVWSFLQLKILDISQYRYKIRIQSIFNEYNFPQQAFFLNLPPPQFSPSILQCLLPYLTSKIYFENEFQNYKSIPFSKICNVSLFKSCISYQPGATLWHANQQTLLQTTCLAWSSIFFVDDAFFVVAALADHAHIVAASSEKRLPAKVKRNRKIRRQKKMEEKTMKRGD